MSEHRRPGCCPTTTSPGTPPASAAGELGLRRARAATLLSLALPGGAYIYQGEELGLEEVLDIPAELRQDPIFARTTANGSAGTAAGCRCPGAARRRRSSSVRAARRGCRSPRRGRTSPSSASRT